MMDDVHPSIANRVEACVVQTPPSRKFDKWVATDVAFNPVLLANQVRVCRRAAISVCIHTTSKSIL